MGSFKEEDERTQVTFKGNGSLGSMQVMYFMVAAGNSLHSLHISAIKPHLKRLCHVACSHGQLMTSMTSVHYAGADVRLLLLSLQSIYV